MATASAHKKALTKVENTISLVLYESLYYTKRPALQCLNQTVWSVGFKIIYFHSLMLHYFYNKSATFSKSKSYLKLTNIICVLHGTIQVGSKDCLSFSAHCHTCFSQNEVPWLCLRLCMWQGSLLCHSIHSGVLDLKRPLVYNLYT